MISLRDFFLAGVVVLVIDATIGATNVSETFCNGWDKDRAKPGQHQCGGFMHGHCRDATNSTGCWRAFYVSVAGIVFFEQAADSLK
jgi:hypothetical protein